MISGALAAALTPLRDGGQALDEGAFEPYARFLEQGGLAGVLALGTTGEGILLTLAERKRVVELYLAAGLRVIAHCGAQTSRDTVELAAHAADVGAAGVAVIGPPYFELDEAALLAHFGAAAHACEPLPFYVYELARASGYSIPLSVLARLREIAPNLTGLKVSDAPFDRFEPYLIEGLDVFVGPERFIHRGLARGAVGAVSALASAFPEAVVDAVHTGSAEATARVGRLRDAVERFPRHAALKRIVRLRGVPMNEDVRGPLRGLTNDEGAAVDEVARAYTSPRV